MILANGERSRSTELGRLCPSSSRLRVLAMLEIYLDDAGTHDDAVTAVIAGYIGPASEWEQLETKWNALLGREDLKFYHSTDSAATFGLFAGRSHAACNALHKEV